MTTTQSIITIAVVMFGTMLTRFLPFIFFSGSKPAPKHITYLGSVLPYAVMSLLIVYCLKDAVFTPPHGLFEILAIVVVGALHIWKKNIFLSISIGTVFYMVLVQNFT